MLEGVLGESFVEFMKPRGNPFRETVTQRATRRGREPEESPAPWTLLEKEWHSAGLSDYIKAHLQGVPQWN